jgi:hypothetical protein
MAFSSLSRNPDSLFQNILGLFYEQAVEINGIACNTSFRIIFPEDVVARLTIVLVHLGCVGFAFFRKLVSSPSIAGFVGLMRAVETGRSLCSFLSSKVTETVVLRFGIGRGVV